MLDIFSSILLVFICINRLHNVLRNTPNVSTTITLPAINLSSFRNLTGYLWSRVNLTIRALLTEENSKRTMICHVCRVMVLFIYIKFLMTTWEELTTTQRKKKNDEENACNTCNFQLASLPLFYIVIFSCYQRVCKNELYAK